MNAVEVLNLSHLYPSKRSSVAPRQALKDLSFSVQEGELFGMLGPNGGGKSTTFHILSTYFPPTSGQALVFGKDIGKESNAVRRRLGVVFQSPGLDPKLSVRENLTHQGHLYGLSGRRLQDRITEVLTRLDLVKRENDYVDTLSGGLKRRAEIAKGLLHQPRLLLLDEPSTGLDPNSRRDLWDYLKELQTKEKMTILVTTHLMEEAEKCDRVAILNEGQLVGYGTPAALKAEIGGDVISLESANPEKLVQAIQAKYPSRITRLGATLRIEQTKGHEFIPTLVSDFPGQISSITLSKPTLEDVFIKKTGHRLWGDVEQETGVRA